MAFNPSLYSSYLDGLMLRSLMDSNQYLSALWTSAQSYHPYFSGHPAVIRTCHSRLNPVPQLFPNPQQTCLPPAPHCLDMKGDDVKGSPTVELEGRELWEKFNDLESEMVITKSGRWVILSQLHSWEICEFILSQLYSWEVGEFILFQLHSWEVGEFILSQFYSWVVG